MHLLGSRVPKPMNYVDENEASVCIKSKVDGGQKWWMRNRNRIDRTMNDADFSSWWAKSRDVDLKATKRRCQVIRTKLFG